MQSVVVSHRANAVPWGQKLHRQPPPSTPHTCMTVVNMHRKRRQRRLLYVCEHVRQYLQGCANVYSTTPSCPLPSVWASPLHNSLFLCVSGLAACVRVIHCFTAHTRDGSQWRSAALYNSFRPHKDFLFLFVAAFTRFFFSPPLRSLLYFITRKNSKKRFGPVHIMSDQLMFGSVLLQYAQVLNTFFFCILFSFPAYSVM